MTASGRESLSKQRKLVYGSKAEPHTQRERVLMRERVLIPINIEEHRKEVVKRFYRAFLPGLYLPLANYSFSIWPVLGPSLTCVPNFLSNMDFNVKLSKRGMIHYGLASPYFWTLSVSAHLRCLLCLKNGKYMASWPFTQTRFNPLFLHNCYTKVSTGDRAWLFTLFQLLLAFQRPNRRLVSKYLTWSPPIELVVRVPP